MENIQALKKWLWISPDNLCAQSVEMARQLKFYTALVMFQSGQVSAGAACEFAGVDRYQFMAECKKHNFPVIDYEEDEIEAELERLKRNGN